VVVEQQDHPTVLLEALVLLEQSTLEEEVEMEVDTLYLSLVVLEVLV
tara:strand:- start:26 stop:166 length:141 start_codon:yes stop_codon:yes gene_type:complete